MSRHRLGPSRAKPAKRRALAVVPPATHQHREHGRHSLCPADAWQVLEQPHWHLAIDLLAAGAPWDEYAEGQTVGAAVFRSEAAAEQAVGEAESRFQTLRWSIGAHLHAAVVPCALGTSWCPAVKRAYGVEYEQEDVPDYLIVDGVPHRVLEPATPIGGSS